MRFIKYIIGFIVGAAGGFSYYYFIGCRSGTCPITGNPFISSIWGGVIGMLLADTIVGLFKKKSTT
jgi:hypothetical protein